jgi:hypothetical protein
MRMNNKKQTYTISLGFQRFLSIGVTIEQALQKINNNLQTQTHFFTTIKLFCCIQTFQHLKLISKEKDDGGILS